MKNETLISLDLLDEVRTTLAAAFSYHDGLDIIESQRKMWPEKRNSNLTLEIHGTLERVEELVSRHVLNERDERRARRAQQEADIPYERVPAPALDDDEDDDVMCDPEEHDIDDDGYCIYCGYDEDQIAEAQDDDGSTVDDSPDAE